MSDFNVQALLDIVQDVAAHASPDAPELCSGPQFDAARAAAGHADAPTAASIGRRMTCSWPALLEVIFDPGRDAMHYVSLRGRDTRGTGLTFADAVAAVAHSASVTHTGGTLSRADHDSVMSRARRAVGSRGASAAQVAWLYPTAEAIDKAVGWQQTLVAAGLVSPPSGAVPGVPLVEVMELFLHENGYLVGEPSLKAWANARGISVARGRATDALAQLHARRDAQGRWTPPAYLPRSLRAQLRAQSTPPAATSTPSGLPYVRRREWPSQEIREGLLIAAKIAHQQRVGFTQRFLKQLAKVDRRAPSWNPVDQDARKVDKTGGDWLRRAERDLAAKLRRWKA